MLIMNLKSEANAENRVSKPDGKLTFDKTSSVYLTGTNHAGSNHPFKVKRSRFTN